ncbi:hypothetical protein RT99_08475 [Flavobacterium sp. MEB061]|nr:hypothetical protein RT99_08475 [Flavobacterium sp. MEB061]
MVNYELYCVIILKKSVFYPRFALAIRVIRVQIHVLKKNIGLSLLVKKLSDLVPSWQKHKK